MKIKIAAALGLILVGMGASNVLFANSDCATCTPTESGVVKGHEEGDVLSFKGIPYAAAPVGTLRFRPPQAPTAWNGVFDAESFRSTCPQTKDALEEYPFPGRKITSGDGTESEVYESEDCLHLNIWTPALDNSKRPIMVFIPGGAFVVGNGSSDFYNGKNLAAHDVVVVTLNYRLGLFGFMELGGVDPRYQGSGNNGLRDQIAAIEWVKRNAASFGGDANNVTIFGESAGGASVTALLSVKDPSKLFKRAIAQSGASNLIHSKEYAVEAGKGIVKAGAFHSVDEMLKASPLDLLRAQEAAYYAAETGDMLFAPFIDGDVIAGDPNRLLIDGHVKDIQIMAGANQNELNYWNLYDSQLRNPFTDETDFGPASPIIPGAYIKDLEKRNRYSLDEKYKTALGTENKSLLHQAQNDDLIMIQPMRKLIERQSLHNKNVYLYRFKWKIPGKYLAKGSPELGSIHALELPFVFGTMNLSWLPGGAKIESEKRASDIRLSEQMMSAWTNFARTGNPNGEGVPEWPTYDANSRKTMIWEDGAKAESDPDAERRKIWESESFDSIL